MFINLLSVLCIHCFQSFAIYEIWTLYGLIASQFGDNSDEMMMADGTKQQVNKFLRSHFGYRHDFMGPVAVATASFSILFALVFALSIKTINFQTG